MARKQTPKIYPDHGEQPPYRKRLLIVGCPRSGTKYATTVWRRSGVPIGHEYVDDCGTCSWLFAVDADQYPYFPWEPPKGRCAHVGERRSQFLFDLCWHQIRQPLRSIGSIALVLGLDQWAWLRESTTIELARASKRTDPILLAMQLWVQWNRLCAEQADWTYRVEDFAAFWPRMTTKVGIPNCPLPAVSPTTNRAKRWAKPYTDREAIQALPDPTFADLKRVSPQWAEEVRRLAAEYRYEVA